MCLWNAHMTWAFQGKQCCRQPMKRNSDSRSHSAVLCTALGSGPLHILLPAQGQVLHVLQEPTPPPPASIPTKHPGTAGEM